MSKIPNYEWAEKQILILNSPDFSCCFVNTTKDPIKTKHVAYFTQDARRDNCELIQVYEVVEETYPHPEFPDEANVVVLRTKFLYEKHKKYASAENLLDLAQNNLKEYQYVKKN